MHADQPVRERARQRRLLPAFSPALQLERRWLLLLLLLLLLEDTLELFEALDALFPRLPRHLGCDGVPPLGCGQAGGELLESKLEKLLLLAAPRLPSTHPTIHINFSNQPPMAQARALTSSRAAGLEGTDAAEADLSAGGLLLTPGGAWVRLTTSSALAKDRLGCH